MLSHIGIVEKITEKKINFIIGNKRPGDPPALVATSKKAKETLNYKSLYSNIETIIDSAWKWHIKMNSLGDNRG